MVFSTDNNWQPESESAQTNIPLRGQTAYIQREKKNRGGKTVTVVTALKGELRSLQKELQKICGSGGTLKNNQIEIQGDHREKVQQHLESLGIKVKMRGG